jgi:hypothetical protein
MIKAYLLKRNKSKSLRTQIRNVERELLNRQRRTGVRTATLVRKIQQQMTAPATLLLAGGIGFILGELTQCQTAKPRGTLEEPRSSEAIPLRTALNLMTLIHTLYTALPLAWMMKFFHQPDVPGQVSERQFQQVAAASGAAESRRWSRR